MAGLAAAAIMSVGAGVASGAEIVVYSTTSMKEALIDLVPEFERESHHRVKMNYAGGSELSKRIQGGLSGDLYLGPDEFSEPLIKQGALQAGSRIALVISRTGLAVRAGAPKLDISTPDKLKAALLAAGKVSYSTGASGIHFVSVLKQLGIADAVAAKRVAAQPGELVGAVVARGAADIGVQQISELLPVQGIQILDPLPKEFQQPLVYGATAFTNSAQFTSARAFVNFLRTEHARVVLRKKGFEPI